jgi:hypothetical protein
MYFGRGRARPEGLSASDYRHRAKPLGKDYWLGPGMRICLAIKAPEEGQKISLRNGPIRLGTFRSVVNSDAAGDWPAALPANPIAEPVLANAEKLNFNFEWVGSASLNVDNGTPPSRWQITGYIFELKNMTQFDHMETGLMAAIEVS